MAESESHCSKSTSNSNLSQSFDNNLPTRPSSPVRWDAECSRSFSVSPSPFNTFGGTAEAERWILGAKMSRKTQKSANCTLKMISQATLRMRMERGQERPDALIREAISQIRASLLGSFSATIDDLDENIYTSDLFPLVHIFGFVETSDYFIFELEIHMAQRG